MKKPIRDTVEYEISGIKVKRCGAVASLREATTARVGHAEPRIPAEPPSPRHDKARTSGGTGPLGKAGVPALTGRAARR